jgi:hypothetical protein
MDNIYGRGSVEFAEKTGGSNTGSPIRKEDSSGLVSESTAEMTVCFLAIFIQRSCKMG